MKKLIVSTVAAAALGFGAAASAQDLGPVLGSVFGFGTPYPGYPAVIAQGHDPRFYTDRFGRQFIYDQYGRQVYVQPQVQPNPPPRQHYGIVGHDPWGRPVWGPVAPTDRDGDTVSDDRDRWPDNAAQW